MNVVLSSKMGVPVKPNSCAFGKKRFNGFVIFAML
jgi:hypothetical protein